MGRRRRDSGSPWRSHELGWFGGGALLLALLVACVCLGGGGVKVADFNLLLQVFCLFGLALIGPRACGRFVKAAPAGLMVLTGLTIAIPALQLIPLPPDLWIALPGRSNVVQSLGMVSAGRVWMPFSLDPNRTAIALFAVLSCLPILLLSASVDRRSARLVPVTIVALGVFSAVLGAIQLSRGNQGLVLQPRGVMPHQLYATFANHNATGLFFVICLVCLVGISPDGQVPRSGSAHRGKPGDLAQLLSAHLTAVKWVLGVLFALCTVLSQSRSALIVMAVVLVWIVLRGRASMVDMARKLHVVLFPRHVWIALAGIVLALAGLGAMVSNHSVRQSLARFQGIDDPRFGIWQDVSSTILTYLPVGAGVGTFDAVFQLDESLEAVTPLKTGRAHSDYLESLVETGFAGPLLILAWSIWIASRIWHARGGEGYVQARVAGMVMACFAMQSAIDYPLRNMAMLAIAAAMIGVLSRSVETGRPEQQFPAGCAA